VSKKNTLIISVIIFVFTIVIIGIFGVVPLPDYSDSINEEIDGKIYYQSSLISSNIIPPAPDLLDDCIFEIEINTSNIIEREVLCSSELLTYSTNFYFYDTVLNNEGNLVVRYWNDSSSSEYALEVNPKNKEILKEYEVENVSIRNQNLNEYGEVLIDSWRKVENTDRSVAIYYQKGSNTVEVFKSEAPSSYYFNSLIWSYDSEKILALDSENQFIIFSKNNIFEPIKLSYSIDEKEREYIRLIEWVKP
jgi:hypothetical protein